MVVERHISLSVAKASRIRRSSSRLRLHRAFRLRGDRHGSIRDMLGRRKSSNLSVLTLVRYRSPSRLHGSSGTLTLDLMLILRLRMLISSIPLRRIQKHRTSNHDHAQRSTPHLRSMHTLRPQRFKTSTFGNPGKLGVQLRMLSTLLHQIHQIHPLQVAR